MAPCWFHKDELHDLHAIIDIGHIYPFELHPPKIFVTYFVTPSHLLQKFEWQYR